MNINAVKIRGLYENEDKWLQGSHVLPLLNVAAYTGRTSKDRTLLQIAALLRSKHDLANSLSVCMMGENASTLSTMTWTCTEIMRLHSGRLLSQLIWQLCGLLHFSFVYQISGWFIWQTTLTNTNVDVTSMNCNQSHHSHQDHTL